MTQNPWKPLLDWYDENKRDLPWRHTADPYRIWLSEIMLQQTRVETVKDYYRRFLTLFPTVKQLAEAPQEQVLKAWEGLGYYSRARNLQKAAQMIIAEWQGAFPSAYDEIVKLPGIGPYTAGAIASIAFREAVPAVDGNVYRVLSRYYGIRSDVGIPSVQKEIRALALQGMPKSRPGDYNQALMELGAVLCTPQSPKCDLCPWHLRCNAEEEGDAEVLPVHEKKKPQKTIEVSVCLLTYGRQVLVQKRQERLLHGLYVFYLIEEEARPEKLEEILSEAGFPCAFEREVGTARHVFTHRIWEMKLFHFTLRDMPSACVLQESNGQMIDGAALSALPFPTAMKAAREAADRLIGDSATIPPADNAE
ncbi:MAG: A/G-specific adenine glycosylase [Eubacteriales bacterium]|nr:A/G-specific adenine glycosylase [Eubacteriales bacterium]